MATAPKRTSDPEAPAPSPPEEGVVSPDGGQATLAPAPSLVESAGDRGVDRTADLTTLTHDHPTDQEIAAEAYAIYVAGGRRDGSDVDDWLAAERRLRERRG